MCVYVDDIFEEFYVDFDSIFRDILMYELLNVIHLGLMISYICTKQWCALSMSNNSKGSVPENTFTMSI